MCCAMRAQWRCVRGVNFQPVQDAGRNDGFEPGRNRIVLSEIRRAILDQWGVFGEDDMIPLPCNPEAISIGYGLRDGTRSGRSLTCSRRTCWCARRRTR